MTNHLNHLKQLIATTVAVVVTVAATSYSPVMAASSSHSHPVVDSTAQTANHTLETKNETSAQRFENESSAQTRQRHCTPVAEMAETIMRNYQSGSSIKHMLQRADETSKEIDAAVRDKVLRIFKETIIEAGTHPKYSSPSYRQKAVTDFSDKIMMRCLLAKHNPFE